MIIMNIVGCWLGMAQGEFLVSFFVSLQMDCHHCVDVLLSLHSTDHQSRLLQEVSLSPDDVSNRQSCFCCVITLSICMVTGIVSCLVMM